MDYEYFKTMGKIANSPMNEGLQLIESSSKVNELTRYISIVKTQEARDRLAREKKIKENQLKKLRPNWDRWKYCEELSFIEAILLALNIDPDNYDNEKGIILGDLCFSFEERSAIKKSFEDLVDLVYRAAKNNPPKIQVVTWNYKPLVKNYEFARWWRSIGKDLPPEFPIQEINSNRSNLIGDLNHEIIEQRDCDHEKYPEELSIANNAWRAVAINGQGEGSTPKRRLENWLRINYKNLNDEQIKRIATVCNWDKARGRK